MSKVKKPPSVRVDNGVDTVSGTALAARAELVGTTATTTPLYLLGGSFKVVIDDYVAAGPVYKAAEKKLAQAEAATLVARGDFFAAHKVLTDCHGAAVKQVQKHSVSSADVASYGFTFLDPVKQGIVLPSGIVVTYNRQTTVLFIHVKYAVKAPHKCVIEISPDPVAPGSYHRLEGDGVQRKLLGYAPGTWWVHAATTVAAERSDWFGPVAIVVK